MNSSLALTLLALTLTAAIVDWYAVGISAKRLEYIAKPAVMVLLIAWFWVSSSAGSSLFSPPGWFLIGFILSLAGDVFLMLPREQFIAGLAAFLLGHVAYLIGFNAGPPPFNLAALVVAAVVGMTASRLSRRLAAGLQSSGNERLRGPVFAYSLVISLMLLSALLTLLRPEWPALPALLVSLGALLFFLSDAMLAWNRFIGPLPGGRVGSLIPYHLGQMLIAIGVAMQYPVG
jgi:uncharacterized membrane protein YhhN